MSTSTTSRLSLLCLILVIPQLYLFRSMNNSVAVDDPDLLKHDLLMATSKQEGTPTSMIQQPQPATTARQLPPAVQEAHFAVSQQEQGPRQGIVPLPEEHLTIPVTPRTPTNQESLPKIQEHIPKTMVNIPSPAASAVQDQHDDIPIILQNEVVGQVTPICKKTGGGGSTNSSAISIRDCAIIIDTDHQKCPSINGPLLIHGQHPNATDKVFLLVSKHVTVSSSNVSLRMFVAQQKNAISSSLMAGSMGSWTELSHKMSMTSVPSCRKDAFSPDIFYDKAKQKYTMHAHLHQCKGHSGGAGQPTAVFTSPDLLHWEPVSDRNPLAATRLFYAKLFTHDGEMYGIAKSQENALGSMTLFHSLSPRGPYKALRQLGQGARHVGLYHKGNYLYVFFTLIGDEPERILLSTIHLEGPASAWELRPGPEILRPLNTDDPSKPSSAGPAPCRPVQELRDPYFLPDNDESPSQLKGTLFYALGGEQAIGASSLRIDLNAYFDKAVPYRNKSKIEPLVWESSSLCTKRSHSDFRDRPLLVTGVGRSGTTFLCTFFNALAIEDDPSTTWQISHDNSVDCGEFGGTVGASAWHHAFRFRGDGMFEMRVERVIHLVRNPLKVVKSRLARNKVIPKLASYLVGLIGSWEDLEVERGRPLNSTSLGSNSTLFASVTLRHWINRNSFVKMHASWRVYNEDLSKPHVLWLLCLEMGHPNCPNIDKIRSTLPKVGHNVKSNGKIANYHDSDVAWWGRLLDVNPTDVRIAMKMKQEYGYVERTEKMLALQQHLGIDEVQYHCGFQNEAAARAGKEKPKKWGCSLV